jgi:hypothetical protein
VVESRKDELLPRAQALIAAGVKKGEAARNVGVHEATLRRWVRESRSAVPGSSASVGLSAVADTEPTDCSDTPVVGLSPDIVASTGATPDAAVQASAVTPEGAPAAPRPHIVARPPRPRTPEAAARLARRLEGRLAVLIEQSEAAPDDPKLEDRMLKICKVLEYLRAGEDDLDAQMAAMKRFVSFCVRNLSEAEMPPVRKALRLFLDHLKREHS